MTRTEFLREQTRSGKNKCARAPLPRLSVADAPCGIAERKALALKEIFDRMPIFIGEKEWIVGTRTLFSPNEGNEDGHDCFAYGLRTHIPYLNREDLERFGCDRSYSNKTHYTPDFGIILEKGIDGILLEVEERRRDKTLNKVQLEFLSAVNIAYTGLKHLICRYEEKARSLAEIAEKEDREELLEIARVCKKVSGDRPDTFREAVQLLWFAHLGTMIESFEFINYGRLDVILGKYLKNTPREQAQQIIECLLLKMYDQVDLVTSYLGNYAAQLVVTLGGVLPNGENAVNEVTMMFLEAAAKIRLPEPEFNLRVSAKNPPDFLNLAARLTVSGCNFISYYNDELFVKSLNLAGVPLEDARNYGFDLCQDVNIPGKGDFYCLCEHSLSISLMNLLETKRDFENFEALIQGLKARISCILAEKIQKYNEAEQHVALYEKGDLPAFFEGVQKHGKPVHCMGNTPMAPLPLLSALYHGSVENASDIAFQPYPIKNKGVFFGTATEAINSLAAIKKTVYDEKRFTLDEVYHACVSNFSGERGAYIQAVLWNCPKWGNDDDFVDRIGKDLLEFCLKECEKHKTSFGARVLGGIHQPHPVPTGKKLQATPEGRKAGMPVSVTLTPESGTMKNGPTAALRSAAKIDPLLVQWNYCVMVNYFASVFHGNDGEEIFKNLLLGYFRQGGLQHQPNVSDAEELRKAQREPEKHKDLVVRLWGVSAHFVDLPKKLQDEMIMRFS